MDDTLKKLNYAKEFMDAMRAAFPVMGMMGGCCGYIDDDMLPYFTEKLKSLKDSEDKKESMDALMKEVQACVEKYQGDKKECHCKKQECESRNGGDVSIDIDEIPDLSSLGDLMSALGAIRTGIFDSINDGNQPEKHGTTAKDDEGGIKDAPEDDDEEVEFHLECCEGDDEELCFGIVKDGKWSFSTYVAGHPEEDVKVDIDPNARIAQIRTINNDKEKFKCEYHYDVILPVNLDYATLNKVVANGVCTLSGVMRRDKKYGTFTL